MSDSILSSMKKMLGFDPEYTAFDTDITIHINSVFSILHQIGASPKEGFFIVDKEQTWEQFLLNKFHVEMVKTYMYLRVRMLFDPPTTSYALESFKKQADELEWRLNVLELEFNPEAYNYGITSGSLYILNPSGDFPEGSQDGDLAIDLETGDVWKDV